MLEEGQCVEFRWGTGTWNSAVVKALTPGMLETQVPSSVFGCLGGSDEAVRVSKRKSDNQPSIKEIDFCTVSNPF